MQRNGNLPDDFVPAWRHVHDIFTSVGANNATWVWCPNVEYTGSYQPLSTLYPGDAYVDWTCLDGYNWGTNPWKPNVWGLQPDVPASYSKITGTIAPSKPMVIAETASTEYGGSKAAWITDMLKTQLPLYFPKIKAFLWFEKWDERGYDWPIETSSTSKSAFATNIQLALYAANNFASLASGKIKPLSG